GAAGRRCHAGDDVLWIDRGINELDPRARGGYSAAPRDRGQQRHLGAFTQRIVGPGDGPVDGHRQPGPEGRQGRVARVQPGAKAVNPCWSRKLELQLAGAQGITGTGEGQESYAHGWMLVRERPGRNPGRHAGGRVEEDGGRAPYTPRSALPGAPRPDLRVYSL